MTGKPNLPACSPQYPRCGACADELDHDGDVLYCEACRLDYPDHTGDGAADYRHEDDEPCGEPPDESDAAFYARVPYPMRLMPCALPAPHTSDCYHPLIEMSEA